MRDIWLNPTRTSNWDSDPFSGNPLRTEQLDLLLSLIADHYVPGSTILDIGSGSGLVEEQIFQRLPDASVVGVDYSPAMIAMAAKRLRGKDKQFVIVQQDLCNLQASKLPERDYRLAFSVQTIHNLPPDSQLKVTSWVHKVLAKPGFFFLLDRIAVPGVFTSDLAGELENSGGLRVRGECPRCTRKSSPDCMCQNKRRCVIQSWRPRSWSKSLDRVWDQAVPAGSGIGCASPLCRAFSFFPPPQVGTDSPFTRQPGSYRYFSTANKPLVILFQLFRDIAIVNHHPEGIPQPILPQIGERID